jgi:hypothetical protein
MSGKRWFELECRHCGQRFIDMVRLLYHACPDRPDAQNRRRSHAKRPTKVRVVTKAQGLFRPGVGAR